eukprot:6541555-Prymnesium_polylepis.1
MRGPFHGEEKCVCVGPFHTCSTYRPFPVTYSHARDGAGRGRAPWLRDRKRGAPCDARSHVA